MMCPKNGTGLFLKPVTSSIYELASFKISLLQSSVQFSHPSIKPIKPHLHSFHTKFLKIIPIHLTEADDEQLNTNLSHLETQMRTFFWLRWLRMSMQWTRVLQLTNHTEPMQTTVCSLQKPSATALTISYRYRQLYQKLCNRFNISPQRFYILWLKKNCGSCFESKHKSILSHTDI